MMNILVQLPEIVNDEFIDEPHRQHPPLPADWAPDARAAGGGGFPFLVNKSNNCTEDDIEKVLFKPAKSLFKSVFVLNENSYKFVELVGLERVGFFTITTPDICSYWTKEGWREAHRRFHSFMTHSYYEIFGKNSRWLVVLEPQNRGAVHWHMLVECPCDIRTGVNFDEFMIKPYGNYRTASNGLRELWGKIRASLKVYGLGRGELLPIRKTREAIAEYIGSYVGKTIQYEALEKRVSGLKRPAGSKRVRYSVGTWRSANHKFAWVESGRKWRAAVAMAAAKMGIVSTEQWTMRFGKRWAYYLGNEILENYEREIAMK